MRNLLALLLVALALSPLTLFAQAPVPVDTGEPIPILSADQLDGLVAPIALYPDPLISQILVASTYPDQVAQAYQFVQANPGLSGPALMQAAAQQNWDPSIQALVAFPDVLARLNQDMSWTASLGNAFLNQQADVMSAVQQMRISAQQSGHLYSTPQQQVINTTYAGQPVVEILPANPEVIYAPVYDPAWVWGPPVYYPYPRWYYPRHSGIVFNFGISVGGFFGAGWHGWGGYGWRPAWGSRTVVVNNTFIRQNHFNPHVTSFARANNYRAPVYNQFRGNPGWNNYRGNVGVQNFAARQNFRPAPAPARPQVNGFASSRMNTYTAPRMNTYAPRMNSYSAPRTNTFAAPARTFAAPARTFAAPARGMNTFTPPARGHAFAEARNNRPSFTPSYSRPAAPMAHGGNGGGGGHAESRGGGRSRGRR